MVRVTDIILPFHSQEGSMSQPVSIAIVGDRDPSADTHRATEASLGHAAASLHLDLAFHWVPTPAAAADARGALAGHSAVWIPPGSPYASMDGALAAIRLAREEGLPLLATCGGFQHVVIEFARAVIGLEDAQHAEYDPNASTLFVTPLSCSLVGRRMRVLLEPGTRAAAAYGTLEAEERYYCRFGLNPERQGLLHSRGLRVAGVDADGEARVLEIPEHRFFIATLFLPQAGSAPGRPHPLVVEFVRAAAGTSHAPGYALSSELI
jgi:CTP synthase (UTP-ammonia lyase)